MYRTYSPVENNNQVAVVPTTHHSPSAFQASPSSAFGDDFGCSPPQKRFCIAIEQISPSTSVTAAAAAAAAAAATASPTTAFNFAEFPDFSAIAQLPPSGAVTAAPNTFKFGEQHQQGFGTAFDAALQQCEDSKVDLASYLQATSAGEAAAVIAVSSMQQQQQHARLGGMELAPPVIRKPEDYNLVVYQQPEEYYRARYETEGIRGPLKGRENNHPAVRVIGPMTYSGTVRVSLVHEDGTKHTSCFLDETKDRQKALSKKIDPQSNMIVEFEDLRIRRETKTKTYNKEGGRKTDKAKTARNDKTACLCFTATIQLAPDQEITKSILSEPIQLCAPPEGAELEWLIPEFGHTNGDEKIVIKGTKMTCPKVTFTVMLPDNQMVELLGHVDKEQSHQNVLVVKTPRLPDDLRNYQGPTLKAEVRVSSGRAGTCSSPLPFYYIPNGLCHTCKQTLPQAPIPLPVQASQSFMAAPFFPITHCTPGLSFASCSGNTSQQQHCGTITSLPSFQEIQQPQVTYPPRQCQQEQMTNASITLSHPPSSTPSPLPSSSTRRDSFQQLFDSPAHPSSVGATSQSPNNLSPTSSPGPVSTGTAATTNNYWNPNLVPSTIPISSVSQSQEAILQTPDFPAIAATSSISLVTSPGSEPIYSAVPSPDTTTSIFNPMMTYMEDPNAQYRQYST